MHVAWRFYKWECFGLAGTGTWVAYLAGLGVDHTNGIIVKECADGKCLGGSGNPRLVG